MIYITQLIYLQEGQAHVFHDFENIAIPLIEKHKGNLLFRIRPTTSTFIDGSIEIPYEIHLINFENEESFENFKNDQERKKFLHLKEQSIKSSIIIQGKEM